MYVTRTDNNKIADERKIITLNDGGLKFDCAKYIPINKYSKYAFSACINSMNIKIKKQKSLVNDFQNVENIKYGIIKRNIKSLVKMR